MESIEMITWRSYDLDVTKTYYNIIERFKNSKITNKRINKKTFIHSFKEKVKAFCNDNGLNMDLYFKTRLPIIIPSSNNFYPFFLADTIMFYDINKINLFLDFQKLNYQGNYYGKKNQFAEMIDNMVYNRIKSLYPYDNNEILGIIANWLNNQKLKKSFKKKTTKKPEINLRKMFHSESEFDNWCVLLEKNKFLYKMEEEGIWQWTGKKILASDSRILRGTKLQLVALSSILAHKQKDKYNSFELYKAYTEYFHIKASPTIFKESEKYKCDKYLPFFYFLSNTLN